MHDRITHILRTDEFFCRPLLGRAIALTSVVSISGFALLRLAEFEPIQYSGVPAGVTMVTARVGDVFCAASLNLRNRQATHVLTR
jgi:hypothetical protein